MIALSSWPAVSQLAYKANPKCPRTVVIQLLSAPTGANAFISSDQAGLDNAQSFVTSGSAQALSVGVGLQDLLQALDQVILFNVRHDIYVRANSFAGGGAVLVSAEAF